jgi:hypothetical protein
MTRTTKAAKTQLYRAYLLRCWQERDIAQDGGARWRFSLEEVLHKEPRQGFESLETLVAFLQDELINEQKGGD